MLGLALLPGPGPAGLRSQTAPRDPALQLAAMSSGLSPGGASKADLRDGPRIAGLPASWSGPNPTPDHPMVENGRRAHGTWLGVVDQAQVHTGLTNPGVLIVEQCQ